MIPRTDNGNLGGGGRRIRAGMCYAGVERGPIGGPLHGGPPAGAEMTYYDAIAGAIVSRREAVREYRRHGLSEADLVADLGESEDYAAEAVLMALGY